MAIAVAAFVGLWLGGVLLLSYASGWRTLAAQYRSDLPFTGRTWRLRSARLRGGMVRYNGMLTVGVNPAGLYIAVLPPLRFGHAPLFIPWSDVTVTTERPVFGSFLAFHFSRVPSVPVWFFDRFGRELLETARVR